ncbi:MAG: ADP-L-glycero-D-manno-heptose-6-epimerase [Nitrospinaceae bacterium]|nr:MAG: ADP-L-glycero-D-manno-heptose-6-epimerase [Nitrospinaceae bacterium]
MIVVTGGAGFIGSAIGHALNKREMSKILIVDDVDHPEKEKNLAALKFDGLQGKDAFLQSVRSRSLTSSIEAIIHMGACSSTTETDQEFLRTNNFVYTRELAAFCLEQGTRFIYASSAATYGDGAQGYRDDESQLDVLRPLNLYGGSKHQFDLWARDKGAFDKIVGLKYFNVYGPNEYHKGDMQSLARKGFYQIQETGKMRLFKSYKPEYKDGGQERDFLYIKDAVAMTLFFLDRPKIGGLFNVGSGKARNWNAMARALFSAMDKEPDIEYIEMPASIRDQYQYHTQAEMGKIQKAGYDAPGTSLEDGIQDYVQNYLAPGKRLGE